MGREPRAVLLLVALAAMGHAARAWIGHPGTPPGAILVRPALGDADPAVHRAAASRLSRPLGGGERVDLNSASAAEVARLPRIGMSLAKRIVEDRTARGPFRGPQDLDRVRGIGPGLLAALADKVHFGGVGSQVAAPPSDAKFSSSMAYDQPSGASAGHRIDLNLASEADLLTLPEIGLGRARAILAYRRDQGPFAAVSDLGRVTGLSRRLVSRLSPLLVVR